MRIPFTTEYHVSRSTCGVLACIIACVQWHNSRPSPGNTISGPLPTQHGPARRRSVVILPRDAHKSAVHALVLSGATPCFLPPLRHPDSGVSLGIGTAAIQAALDECGDEVCRWTRWEIGSARKGVTEGRYTWAGTSLNLDFFHVYFYLKGWWTDIIRCTQTRFHARYASTI